MSARARWRWLTSDAVLLPLVCLFDLMVASTSIINDTGTGPMKREAQLLAAVLGTVLLVWRRRAPVLVFAAVWGHAVAVWFLLHEYRPTTALIVALYAVAVSRPRGVSLAVLGAAIARSGLSGIDSVRVERYPQAQAGEFVVTVLMFAVVYATTWAIGTIVRGHRARVQDMERDRLRARDEAVAAERQRIAAELHDVVSHSVTLMVLQAAGAARLTGTDAARVHQALLHIQNAGQQAMAELRRLLDVLQMSGRSAPGTLGPVPGLRDLPALIDTVRGAGVQVRLETAGLPLPLDPSVELTAYRVVQESLTNTLKHAGPGSRIGIRLTWADPVTLEVDDDGMGTLAGTGLSTGHGLASLAERVRTAGGSLASGPRPEGGFRVTATLPLSTTPVPVAS